MNEISSSQKNFRLVIPDLSKDSGYTHHPISTGQSPRRYKLAELTDTGEARTGWVGLFEEYLVGLYWWGDNNPVPYAFTLGNDKVRSLDAGCLKWLFERQPPEVAFLFDPQGYIAAAIPSEALLAKYADRKFELTERLTWRKPGT